MDGCKKDLCIFLLVILFLSIRDASATKAEQELAWKVKKGDSTTYTYVKFYDLQDSDGNGDPNSKTIEVEKKNGEKVNILIQNGSTMKVVISTLTSDDPSATIQISYGEITTKSWKDYTVSYVMQTVEDKTYWEEEAAIRFNNASIRDDFIVWELKTTESGITTERTRKVNWKSGWWTYDYIKISNGSTIISEEEISGVSTRSANGFGLIPLFIGVFVISFAASKKRK